MKVVLFCGGLGMRIRENGGAIPKPMIAIGSRPLVAHVMRYYAHYGHREFILCVGHQAEIFKRYFCDETSPGVEPDGRPWRIRFSEAGIDANIGERLVAARAHLGDDDVFLANYGDVLTDAPLDAGIEQFLRSGKVAALLSVRPPYSFHVVRGTEEGVVEKVAAAGAAGIRINGGYFIFRRRIFDYIRPGEELVDQPFARLIAEQQLLAIRHDGFWAPMDTLKDLRALEDLHAGGSPPWIPIGPPTVTHVAVSEP